MNMHSDTPTSAPQPVCDTIAPQLPLLHTGALPPAISASVEEHIRTCASCRSQRADLDRVETVLRRMYSPGASPFQPITLNDIHSRVERQPAVGVTQKTSDSILMLTSPQPENPPTTGPQGDQGLFSKRHLPLWLPRLTPVAAVILLVSLFALLFQTVAPRGSATRIPTSTVSPTMPLATATPIHYLGARAHWEQTAQLQGDPQTPYMIYTVSEADPHVMYRFQLIVEKVERSENSGASWQTLPIPTNDVAPSDHPNVIVSPSPLDSRVVVLTYQLMSGNSTCPAGDYCEIQYISRDGGQHWQHLKLPTGTSLSVVGFVGPSTSTSLAESMFIAQGTHLFAALHSDNGAFSGYRLMMSIDGGATWTFVDGAIVANKQSIIQGVATSTGSTLFVLTIAASIPFENASRVTRLLWRSNDQGKHWTTVGTFPDVQGSRARIGGASTHLAAVTMGPDGRPLVYYVDESETSEQQAQPLDVTMLAPGHLFASRDGGNTWTPAPIPGIPHNDQIVIANVGQLVDGSLVTEVSHLTSKHPDSNSTVVMQNDTAYYAWKPGDATWRQLTSTAPGQMFLQQWLSPAQDTSPEVIWLLTRQGTTWTLQRCALS